MQRGLSMWIMSKLVMMIFLFSLVLVLTLFMRVYSDKIVADTAHSYTLLWGEVASGSLLYAVNSDTVYMPDIIRVREANREYTLLIRRVGTERITLFLAWFLHDTIEDMQTEGFASATAVNMPLDISESGEILLFEGLPGEVRFEPTATDSLIVRPAVRLNRDTTLIFYRNKSYFCAATVKEGVPVEQSIDLLGSCCGVGWEDNDRCS